MQIAFFDVDKTLVRISTGVAVAKYYRRKGQIGLGMMFWTVIYSILHFFDLVDENAMMKRVLVPFVGRIQSKVHQEIIAAYDQLIEPEIFMEALDLINQHKEKGHKVVLLTSTSFEVAQILSERLNVEYIATQVVIDNDIYTDQLIFPIPYGDGKLYRAKEYCEKNGCTLEDAYLYTDSHSDLPLLQKVGHPKVVNPDVRLRKKAVAMGWEILEFKNVQGVQH